MRSEDKGAVVECHFAVFDEVVEEGEEVAFGAVDAFEDEDASAGVGRCCSLDEGRVGKC